MKAKTKYNIAMALLFTVVIFVEPIVDSLDTLISGLYL